MKYQTEIDGKSVEIDLPEGTILGTEAANYVKKDFFESEISRRVNAAKNNAKNEIIKDEVFVSEILKSKGIEIDPATGKPKSSNIDIEKVKNQFFEENVKPLKDKLESVRRKQLESEIVANAAQLGVKEEFLKPVFGAKPLIVQMTENAFGFDEEKGVWAQKDTNGFKYSSNPTQENPYAGALDVLKGLKTNAEFKGFFKETTQAGSNYSGGQGQASGIISLKASEINNNPKAYQDAKEIALKEGKEIKIINE